MKIFLPKDTILLDAVSTYYHTKDLYKFVEIGGLWLIQTVKFKYGMTEDDASELFLVFYSLAERCLLRYRKRRYANFMAYFTIYVRYMVMNYKRRKTVLQEQYHEAARGFFFNKNISHNCNQKYEFVIQYIRSLPAVEKFLFIFRYNLYFSKQDIPQLEDTLKRGNYSLKDFLKMRSRKIHIHSMKQEKLSSKLNSYTRKIYKANSGEQTQVLKSKRERVCYILKNKEPIFSVRELSEVFQVKSSKINFLLNRHIEILRREAEKYF